MYAGQKGQGNKHLTVREIVEFVNQKEYTPGMLEKNASVISHLSICEKCRQIQQSVIKLNDIFENSNFEQTQVENSESNNDEIFEL